VTVARSAAGLLVMGLLVIGCDGGSDSGSSDTTQPEVPDMITVTSTAFEEGAPIPSRYTCDDANVAPPLAWQGVPDDAAAVALVMDDPDAPSGTFTHWVVVDIPAGTSSSIEGGVPQGGVQAQNSAGESSYFGPCPPSGTHHYRFTIYALSSATGLNEGVDLDTALAAIAEVATSQGRLTGTYARAG
jgi:Raf kinase inhibitor-like YbhB/YbcL family protein